MVSTLPSLNNLCVLSLKGHIVHDIWHKTIGNSYGYYDQN